MTEKLATFKIEADKWEAFKDWCNGRGSNASVEIKRFITNCIEGRIDGIDGSIDETVSGIDEDALAKKINSLVEDAIARQREEIEAIVSDRISQHLEGTNEAMKRNLEGIEAKIPQFDWSFKIAELGDRLTKAEDNIRAIRSDVKRDLNDALDETRNRYTSMGKQIRGILDRVIEIENASSQNEEEAEDSEVAIAVDEEEEGLNQKKLADRLNVSASNIKRNRDKGDDHFAQWSREKDPDDLPWRFDEEVKRFFPIASSGWMTTGEGGKADQQLQEIASLLESDGYHLEKGVTDSQFPNWNVVKGTSNKGKLFCGQGHWSLEGEVLAELFDNNPDTWRDFLENNGIFD